MGIGKLWRPRWENQLTSNWSHGSPPSPIPRGTRLRDFNLSHRNKKATTEDFNKTMGIRNNKWNDVVISWPKLSIIKIPLTIGRIFVAYGYREGVEPQDCRGFVIKFERLKLT
jgi:hypothetical protein